MHVERLPISSLPPAQTSSAEVLSNIVLTENELCDRLANAVPGDIIPYHIGMLARDRWPASFVLPEARRIELNAIGSRVLELAEAGLVHLLQRRVGPERFLYVVIVRKRPRQLRQSRHAVPLNVQRQLAAA